MVSEAPAQLPNASHKLHRPDFLLDVKERRANSNCQPVKTRTDTSAYLGLATAAPQLATSRAIMGWGFSNTHHHVDLTEVGTLTGTRPRVQAPLMAPP